MSLSLPPIRICLLGFAGGIVLLQQQANLPQRPGWWLLGVILVGLANLKCYSTRGRLVLAQRLLWVGIAFTFGWSWAAWRAELRLESYLPAALEGKSVRVVGIISELPQQSKQGIRFGFRVEQVEPPTTAIPTKLSLAWYFDNYEPKITADLNSRRTKYLPAMPLPGERWSLQVRLKQPHGLANPHGFDYEAWLLERGYRATGSVIRAGSNQKLSDFVGNPFEAVDRLRALIKDHLLLVLAGKPYLGVVVALAIGDQSLVTQEQWSDFNRTGIGHLISISGLHVTLFAALLSGLLWQFWRRLTWLSSRLPAQKASVLVGFLGALAYVLIAGSAIPAQRTLYMLGVAAVSLWINRPGTAWLAWLWALMLVLFIDPWAVLSPGFWLSFSAVGLIFYVTLGTYSSATPSVTQTTTGEVGDASSRLWTNMSIKLRTAARVQGAITLGLIPFSLVWFQSTSLISPIANAIAIPLVSFGVVPLVLLGALSNVDWPLHLAHFLLQWLGVVMEWLADQPWAIWEQSAPSIWAATLGLGGILLILAPPGFPGRRLGWIWLLPLFFPWKKTLSPGDVTVVIFDVGQGLAALVRTKEHSLLYDTGPRYTPQTDAASRVLIPYLRGEGLQHLTSLTLSHQDQDHTGGLISILQGLTIARIDSSFPVMEKILPRSNQQVGNDVAQPSSLAKNGIKDGNLELANLHWCRAGEHWEWDQVQFDWLFPTEAIYQNPPPKTNDTSCVLKITSPGGTILLTGDIEARSESLLVEQYGEGLRADVLVVPHHGSKTSSSLAFLQHVQPRWAIFPVGYQNRFHHPHPQVLARYQAMRVPMLRTDQLGAVTVDFRSGAEPRISSYRRQHPHYWYPSQPFQGDRSEIGINLKEEQVDRDFTSEGELQ